MRPSVQNLPDCWWQIPPFGKDFHVIFPTKTAKIPEMTTALNFGTQPA
jgi:hypothetical protein